MRNDLPNDYEKRAYNAAVAKFASHCHVDILWLLECLESSQQCIAEISQDLANLRVLLRSAEEERDRLLRERYAEQGVVE